MGCGNTNEKGGGEFLLGIRALRVRLERGCLDGGRERRYGAATEREILGGEPLGGGAEERNK